MFVTERQKEVVVAVNLGDLRKEQRLKYVGSLKNAFPGEAIVVVVDDPDLFNRKVWVKVIIVTKSFEKDPVFVGDLIQARPETLSPL